MSFRHTFSGMANRHTHGEAADDALLSASDLATEWGVSVRTIQRYISSGRIAATKLPSGHSRIRRSDANAALKRVSA